MTSELAMDRSVLLWVCCLIVLFHAPGCKGMILRQKPMYTLIGRPLTLACVNTDQNQFVKPYLIQLLRNDEWIINIDSNCKIIGSIDTKKYTYGCSKNGKFSLTIKNVTQDDIGFIWSCRRLAKLFDNWTVLGKSNSIKLATPKTLLAVEGYRMGISFKRPQPIDTMLEFYLDGKGIAKLTWNKDKCEVVKVRDHLVLTKYNYTCHESQVDWWFNNVSMAEENGQIWTCNMVGKLNNIQYVSMSSARLAVIEKPTIALTNVVKQNETSAAVALATCTVTVAMPTLHNFSLVWSFRGVKSIHQGTPEYSKATGNYSLTNTYIAPVNRSDDGKQLKCYARIGQRFYNHASVTVLVHDNVNDNIITSTTGASTTPQNMTLGGQNGTEVDYIENGDMADSGSLVFLIGGLVLAVVVTAIVIVLTVTIRRVCSNIKREVNGRLVDRKRHSYKETIELNFTNKAGVVTNGVFYVDYTDEPEGERSMIIHNVDNWAGFVGGASNGPDVFSANGLNEYELEPSSDSDIPPE